MKYYYFVSYVCQDALNRGMGYGNLFFDTYFKIRNKDDGDLVIKEIEKTGVSKITIMNVTLLDTEELT
jgi:hypothetical protein